MTNYLNILNKISINKYEIPKNYKSGMRVPGIIYINDELLHLIKEDASIEQVANVAALPGIIDASFAMPDIHWGYGFPIGGVAAFDLDNGVIVPGGIGYDINCGVRLIRSNFSKNEFTKISEKIGFELFNNIPVGVGSHGKIRLKRNEFENLIVDGAEFLIKSGYGIKEDLDFIEEHGKFKDVALKNISLKAIERGMPEIGSLGSGNHFLEIQYIDEIFDNDSAKVFGLYKDQIVILIHTGSRGFGHQIASDYIKEMEKSTQKYNIKVKDRQLACAPIKSSEGSNYYNAMCAAANFAWANRQAITYWVRESFEKIFNKKWEDMDLSIVYDVAHNIAKIETHIVDDKNKRVLVHRKGATRAFPKNSNEIPVQYKDIGQPVLIPGDMGTESYVVVGLEKINKETFGSTCHGAGRLLSRGAASRSVDISKLIKELAEKEIKVFSKNRESLKEEAPEAYKNVNMVINVLEEINLIKKVARMKPLVVIKG